MSDLHSARAEPPAPSDLPTFRWDRPAFEAVDGIGPLPGLATLDGMVLAIGTIEAGRTRAFGSGVMVAPGLLLTATHVLDEFRSRGAGPCACSFLADGSMRIWLPFESSTASRLDPVVLPGQPARRHTSDIALVSCELMSAALSHHPLLMACLEVALPLPGERLWAVGYREHGTGPDGAALSMIVSSGMVTQCYPHGRGSLLGAPCVEVAMNTPGGMSGGPVFNDDGRLVGIVSRSFEAADHQGPSYVTLVWDALRFHVRSAVWPPGRWPAETSILDARDRSLARIKGDVRREGADVVVNLPSPQIAVIAATAPHGTDAVSGN